MAGNWAASAELSAPGWTAVPNGLSISEQNLWVDEQVTRLRSLWSTSWEEEWASGLADFLTSELNSSESGRLLSALCWPVAGPFLAKVGVWVVPQTPLSEWKEVGFEVDGFHSAGLGPGAQCVDLTAVDVNGASVEAATAHYLFGDGEHMVQVTVGPTFKGLYLVMMPDLHQFIDSLQVRRPDSQDFRAVSDPSVGFVGSDIWDDVEEDNDERD